MLRVQGVRKSYRSGGHLTTALHGVDLTLEEGSFGTVLGPSGSGKTTLLRCIAGFENIEGGSITLNGRTLDSAGTQSVRPYERGIGVVPQEGALFPHLTVARNVAFGIADRSRSWRRARVADLLELVGLPGLDDRAPHQLSGGQQQRVALARALAPEPALVLLDEPFSALDAQLRVELREEVRDLLRGLGTTALLVTHDQAEAMTLADHLVVMREGRVVAAGAPRQVYTEPTDAALGRFLGDAVVLTGTVHEHGAAQVVSCVLGRLDVAGPVEGGRPTPPGPCHVLVRPEQLLVRRAGPEVTSSVVTLSDSASPAREQSPTGLVVAQSFYGHDALVRVLLEGGTRLAVRVSNEQRFEVGDRVQVQVTSAVWTIPASLAAPTAPQG